MIAIVKFGNGQNPSKNQFMNDLINIKVIQKDFNGEKKRFVNARELYRWLGVGRDYST